MIVRQGVLRNTSNHSSPLRMCFILALFLLASAVIFTPDSFAEEANAIASKSNASQSNASTYGPIKGGESLWNIAQKSRPDQALSVEQLVYAFYNLNPGAFQSNNMNLLIKGAILKIPDAKTVSNITEAEAIKQIRQHVHALEVIRVDAKQLRIAKKKTGFYKRRIKALQKELGKYRHRSGNWNRTYRKLVKYKRNVAHSKRKVAKLRRLLLEKATLKYSRASNNRLVNKSLVNKQVPNNDTHNSKINQRLSQIQSSLANLSQSNKQLLEKANELETLNQRVKVIEDELGKNDELVIQLQKAMKNVQQTIAEQKQQSEKFLLQLEALKANNRDPDNTRDNDSNKTSLPAPTLQNPPPNKHVASITNDPVLISKTISGHFSNKQAAAVSSTRSVRAKIVETPNLIPPNRATPKNKTITNTSVTGPAILAMQNIHANNADSFTNRQQDNAHNKTGTIKNIKTETFITPGVSFQTPSPTFPIQKGFKPFETDGLSNPKKSSDLKRSDAHRAATDVVHYPQNNRNNRSLNKTQNSWASFVRNNIILIGGLLNGIILIFVIVRLFTGKQTFLQLDDRNLSDSTSHTRWQDRDKPKYPDSNLF